MERTAHRQIVRINVAEKCRPKLSIYLNRINSVAQVMLIFAASRILPKMNNFKPGDLVYWVFKNGDKALCSIRNVLDDGRLRVIWHKDNFVNIMPMHGFIKANI